MGKKPAISKAYKRRPGSGSTSSSKGGKSASGKPASKPVSRKDREYMAEFGTLDIDAIRDSDEDELLIEESARELDKMVAKGEVHMDGVLSDDDASPSHFEQLMTRLGADKPAKKKKSLLEAFKARAAETAQLRQEQQEAVEAQQQDGSDPSLIRMKRRRWTMLNLGEDEDDEDVVESDEEDSTAPNTTYPNHYESQFCDNTERSAHVRSMVAGLDSGTHAWSTRPLADHVTYQIPQSRTTPPSASEIAALESALNTVPDINNMHIKSRVLAKFLARNPTQSPQFMDVFGKLDQYHDILWTGPDFVHQSTAARLRRAYVLHVLNHVYKYGDRVLRGNAKLKAAAEGSADAKMPQVDLNNEEAMAKIEAAVSGSSKPKPAAAPSATAPEVDVLIITPMRNTAWDIVSLMMDMSGTDQQDNKNRFKDEYFTDDKEDAAFEKRPADYRATFRGNTDDCFKLGIRFSKRSMKIYSQFYQSDVIVASPLGLRMMMEAERDADFLSSIEVLVVDGAHVLNMQNWDHLTYVFEHLNRIPKKAHDTDFSRIKSWYLDDLSKAYRQTVILSEYSFPELTSLFNEHALNVQRARIRYRYQVKHGSIVNVRTSAPQTFVKLDASLDTMDDVRFKYLMAGQSELDYFDFVRLRNYMDDADYDFEVISEYTDQSDKARARTLFFQGRTRILVYTERTHFFQRLVLKGALHVVFYGLPDNAVFYPEVCNFLTLPRSQALQAACRTAPSTVADGDVTVVYSKWDALKLERVVGPNRVAKLLQGAGPLPDI
ncbi:hypothetical protein BCR44DRAFT_1428139, partial [Catenaria anguillulae PL171]